MENFPIKLKGKANCPATKDGSKADKGQQSQQWATTHRGIEAAALNAV